MVATVAVPVLDMTAEQFANFSARMHLQITEESLLYEFPQKQTDLSDGAEVVYGPWLPKDCAHALLIWLDAGLLALWRTHPDGSNDDLSRDDARAVLMDPDSWQGPPRNESARTYESSAGADTPLDTWLTHLAPLRSSN